MKSINTLSVFITLCLTLLVTLFLSTATVRAAQLPKAQLEKVELVKKAELNKQALQNVAATMINLQLAPVQTELTINSSFAKQQVAKTVRQQKTRKVTLIAE